MILRTWRQNPDRRRSGRPFRCRTRNGGIISIIALVFLGVFAAIGVAYATLSNNSLLQGQNHTCMLNARLQAESGLSFLLRDVCQVSLPAGTQEQGLLDAVASSVQSRLNGSPNLQGRPVTYDGTTIAIPSIRTDEGSFHGTIALANDTALLLQVTGASGSVTRTVAIQCKVAPGTSMLLDCGVASRDKIRMSGNAGIRGANDPSEAGMLSATYEDLEAFEVSGNSDIEGDIYVSNPDAHVTLAGSIRIGGESAWGDGIADHIHIGVGDVEFPALDPNVFAPYAVNIVDDATPTSGNRTFNNIRILAGVNPNFSGNIALNGVILVEVPNSVQLTGNVTLTGVVVTADAGDDAYENNRIKFAGNMRSRSVTELPDTAEFHDLRQMTGTFILAPGFAVEFTGNFGTVNGAMAAAEFKWTGNAGGTVLGPIVSYSSAEFRLTGNSNITIDRSEGSDIPPGFVAPSKLVPDVNTYTEF